MGKGGRWQEGKEKKWKEEKEGEREEAKKSTDSKNKSRRGAPWAKASGNPYPSPYPGSQRRMGVDAISTGVRPEVPTILASHPKTAPF